MLYNNAQYKNETTDQGCAVEYYEKLRDLISKNDGPRSFIIRTEDCHDQKHTHTVCVPYYKAAPYNISHTKIFQWRFHFNFFFMYVYHA